MGSTLTLTPACRRALAHFRQRAVTFPGKFSYPFKGDGAACTVLFRAGYLERQKGDGTPTHYKRLKYAYRLTALGHAATPEPVYPAVVWPHVPTQLGAIHVAYLRRGLDWRVRIHRITTNAARTHVTLWIQTRGLVGFARDVAALVRCYVSGAVVTDTHVWTAKRRPWVSVTFYVARPVPSPCYLLSAENPVAPEPEPAVPVAEWPIELAPADDGPLAAWHELSPEARAFLRDLRDAGGRDAVNGTSESALRELERPLYIFRFPADRAAVLTTRGAELVKTGDAAEDIWNEPAYSQIVAHVAAGSSEYVRACLDLEVNR